MVKLCLEVSNVSVLNKIDYWIVWGSLTVPFAVYASVKTDYNWSCKTKPLVWEREFGTKDFGIQLDWIHICLSFNFLQILYPDLSRQIRADWQKKGTNAKKDEIGVAAAAEGDQSYCSLNQFCLHNTTNALLFPGAIAPISLDNMK